MTNPSSVNNPALIDNKSRADLAVSSSAHQKTNRLLIIDGNAILHRAFHAIPPLTDPSGRTINAVYGFTSMVYRLVDDLRPTHLCVAFDKKAPTFRKKIFPGYQSKRPKMDDALVGQIPIVHEVVEKMGLPIFEMDGFEADDVIGTLTKSCAHPDDASRAHLDAIIVTGDKDILQLVNDHVFTYMPTKGLSEAKLYGAKETVKRLGVRPEKIPDLKALMGDSSDNYPGVPGIGPKTALMLLEKYGSIENMYEHIDTDDVISAGVKEKLVSGRESAIMSKDLATIRQNVPIEIDEEKLVVGDIKNPEIIDMLDSLGFHSLTKRLKKGNEKEAEKVEKKEKKKSMISENQMELI